MTLIAQMISSQIGIIHHYTGTITHVRFLADTVCVYQYYEYCSANFIRGESDGESLQVNEAYEHLSYTHRTRVCACMADNGRLLEPLSKEALHICGQHITYFLVRHHHQNTIVECMINELILGRHTVLLHTTRMWPEAVSTMLWTFSFKATCQR